MIARIRKLLGREDGELSSQAILDGLDEVDAELKTHQATLSTLRSERQKILLDGSYEESTANEQQVAGVLWEIERLTTAAKHLESSLKRAEKAERDAEEEVTIVEAEAIIDAYGKKVARYNKLAAQMAQLLASMEQDDASVRQTMERVEHAGRLRQPNHEHRSHNRPLYDVAVIPQAVEDGAMFPLLAPRDVHFQRPPPPPSKSVPRVAEPRKPIVTRGDGSDPTKPRVPDPRSRAPFQV